MKKLFSIQLIMFLLISACLKKQASSEETYKETTQIIPENSVGETYPDSLFSGKPEYIADKFGVPVGPPDGKGYIIASPFWNRYQGEYRHLGEDWSGIEGGNSDLGDTIYAIASGYVSWVKMGDPIATIGNGRGRFLAHLHMELRLNNGSDITNGGYALQPYGFINPDKFRRAYNQN
jgi:hypothetical protein